MFLLEKFVNTDIEMSENKKPIRNFRLGCSKAFYIRLPRILKGNKAVQRLFMSDCPERQLKHKREAKIAFDNSRKIWENPDH